MSTINKGQGHSIKEKCGIVDHTSDMATELKERQKEKEKQMKLINMATKLKKRQKRIAKLSEGINRKH